MTWAQTVYNWGVPLFVPQQAARRVYLTATVKFSKALFEGLLFGGAYIHSEGLIYGGKFAFQLDWVSLIDGSKFTVFALFYFVFEGSFPSTSPWRAYIWRGVLTKGFLRYGVGGLIFGGAYTWRGLFSDFTVVYYSTKTRTA